MTKPRLLIGAALLTAAVLVAGCATGTATNPSGTPASAPGAGGSAAGASAAASTAPAATGTYRDQIMAWGLRFAACVRAHGAPNFPDPVYPPNVGPNGPHGSIFDGFAWGMGLFTITDKAGFAGPMAACDDVFGQMPPAPDTNHAPTSAEMTILRRFAQCMRRHGFPDFPDPKADGTFPILGGPYASLHPPFHNVPIQLGNAFDACTATQRIPMVAS
jgi:hypothetical protein